MAILRGPDALRCLSGDICGGEINVRCPYCGGDFTHIRHVGTLVGSDKLEATAAYEGTVPAGATGARRSALEVVFDCETCPKPFALVIQQHKGNNMLEIHTDLPG